VRGFGPVITTHWKMGDNSAAWLGHRACSDSVVTVDGWLGATADGANGSNGDLRSRKLKAQIKSQKDMLWQENPDRVLKYRPDHLHYYGWLPFFVLRNLKAMVFSNVYLHLQGLALLAWVAVLHITGLSIPEGDLASFLRLFGTPYAGAIFNMSMLITFILGLFVTLVVNRWATIKQAYSRMIGATLDLCMLVASAVHDPKGVNERKTFQARKELTRLLNLGHLLAVSRADSLDRDFKPGHGVGHLARTIRESFYHKQKAQGQVTPKGPVPGDSAFWFKKPRNIGYDDLTGLVRMDEWAILERVEQKGLPKFQIVYYWAQALLHRCKAEQWIVSENQMLPIMLNKLNVVVESASQMFTTIGSQMPYPYVHLVSFVAHVYLLVTATWYGAFLYVGFPVEERFNTRVTGEDVSLYKGNRDVSDSYWTVVWCYFFVFLANIMFQGLLDLHSLLDNPFGMHCTKFPLKAQSTSLMNATSTMLTESDTIPEAVQAVFSGGVRPANENER